MGGNDGHDALMCDRKRKWRSFWLLIEFWFALLLTIGIMLYGAWSAVRTVVDGA